MTILKDYKQFGGRHWETGSVHNALAYQGVKGPHNGKPLSEALLMGISGGLAFGFFFFHYESFDPQLVLLTRNTFDPMQTLLERLGAVQTVLHTTTPQKAQSNLMRVLEDGQPAIVWADMTSLPYNADLYNKFYWAMQPIVVFGHDGKTAYVADRSKVALEVSAQDLEKARARVKKDKFRIVTLDLPSTDKLPGAVQQALWQCIRLFTEKPPRGTRKNFGLSAYEHWANMLTNTRNPQSWERYYPPGAGMFAALAGSGAFPGMYAWTRGFGDGGGERGRYADFLDEAATLLNKPGLKDAAKIFRESHAAWKKLGQLALPDDVSLFKDARDLLDRQYSLFVEQGSAATDEILAAKKRFADLRKLAIKDFPLNSAEVITFRERLATHVLAIRDIEARGVEAMQSALL
jgi:hypothetical protein